MCTLAFSFESVKRRFLSLAGSALIVAAAGSPALLSVAQDQSETAEVTNPAPTAAQLAVQQEKCLRLARLAAGILPEQTIVPELLAQAKSNNVEILVSLEKRTLVLLVDGKPALSCPICCGRTGMATPTGKFEVESVSQKPPKDNSYGSLIDSGGNLILKGVYTNYDPLPVGASFVPSPPNFTLSLTEGVVIHSGDANGTASSRGAVIIPTPVAGKLIAVVRKGTKVRIE